MAGVGLGVIHVAGWGALRATPFQALAWRSPIWISQPGRQPQ